MEKFEHKRPVGNSERFGSEHRLELMIDGEKVGYAAFEYHSRPFPLYYINILAVGKDGNQKDWGKGYAGKIMAYLEDMLDKSGKAGILIDAIDENSPAKGMYERRGWHPVPGTAYLAYNIPNSASIERLKEYQPRTENDSRMNRLWQTREIGELPNN
ncbi:MAG: GNAT family N-acetyltransferase [Bacillota bacterium]